VITQLYTQTLIGARILYDKLREKITLIKKLWVLTSFSIQWAGSKNSPIINAIVEEDSGPLHDATSEPFADYERTVHVVVGKR